MNAPVPSLRSEALLYLRWLRGACGPSLWLETGPVGAPPGRGDGGAGGVGASAPGRGASAAPRVVDGPTAGGGRGGLPVRPATVTPPPAPPVPPAAAPAQPPSSPTADAPGAPPFRSPPSPGSPPAPPSSAAGDRIPVGAAATPTPPLEDPLLALDDEASACRRCALCETRTTVVFGEGARRPRLVVVGEAPGADEDACGRPFVGKAGQLLTRMLLAIGLSRDDVYICNVLKCRPPGNRAPAPDEVAACRPYLVEQLRLLAPELLLLLGNHATRAVLGTDRGITSLRGRIQPTPEGVPALPTFHPSYLLRTPAAKKEAWLDLQLVARTLGLELPGAPRPPTPHGGNDGAGDAE